MAGAKRHSVTDAPDPSADGRDVAGRIGCVARPWCARGTPRDGRVAACPFVRSVDRSAPGAAANRLGCSVNVGSSSVHSGLTALAGAVVRGGWYNAGRHRTGANALAACRPAVFFFSRGPSAADGRPPATLARSVIQRPKRIVKRLLRSCFVFLLGATCGAAAVGIFDRRDPLTEQWELYRLIECETWSDARGRLAWFEAEPRRAQKLDLLVSRWGTGHTIFDEHLVRYACQARGADALREALAGQLSRRPELLPRWAHYWAWKSTLSPADEMESVCRYLATLIQAEPPRSITWREVLDVQAVLTLEGHPDLAAQVAAERWQEPYRRWVAAGGGLPLRTVRRPELPLPEWVGAPPDRR